MKRLFAVALAFLGWAATPAFAESALTPERQTYLEGVWNGIPAEGDASKLCTDRAVNSVTLSIEYLRTGGTAFLDDGTENASRGPITQASEADGIVSLTLNNEVWRFRPAGDKIMMRVRNSASLGGDVDTMVFKRCKDAADRTGIQLDDAGLKFLASDMPGDEAFFVDKRIVAKNPKACTADETQYLYFALTGPAEFRLSRWNSFALADKLASNGASNLPLEPVANWKITSARNEGGKYILQIRDYDDAAAAVQTIHVEPKPTGEITIPEWKHSFVRCKGFNNRS